MKIKLFFSLLLGVFGLWLSLAVSGAEATACPPDSVQSGDTCMDKYEASVWEIPNVPANKSLIGRVKAGRATLATLTSPTAIADGVVQRGVSSDDYPCDDDGNDCTTIYAVSIPGVTPSRFNTWFQAAAAARNAGKRLSSNAEWQAAALGTPDPGPSPGAADCNTNSAGPSLTGARANCVSGVGAFDMVGNLWEWVAEWVPLSTAVPGWGGFSDDYMGLAGASTTGGPGALLRGGNFVIGGTSAGVFAVSGQTAPSSVDLSIGFRAAR